MSGRFDDDFGRSKKSRSKRPPARKRPARKSPPKKRPQGRAGPKARSHPSARPAPMPPRETPIRATSSCSPACSMGELIDHLIKEGVIPPTEEAKTAATIAAQPLITQVKQRKITPSAAVQALRSDKALDFSQKKAQKIVIKQTATSEEKDSVKEAEEDGSLDLLKEAAKQKEKLKKAEAELASHQAKIQAETAAKAAEEAEARATTLNQQKLKAQAEAAEIQRKQKEAAAAELLRQKEEKESEIQRLRSQQQHEDASRKEIEKKQLERAAAVAAKEASTAIAIEQAAKEIAAHPILPQTHQWAQRYGSRKKGIRYKCRNGMELYTFSGKQACRPVVVTEVVETPRGRQELPPVFAEERLPEPEAIKKELLEIDSSPLMQAAVEEAEAEGKLEAEAELAPEVTLEMAEEAIAVTPPELKTAVQQDLIIDAVAADIIEKSLETLPDEEGFILEKWQIIGGLSLAFIAGGLIMK
ncbi:hypothetical protein CMI47_07150 [Candidatus Pacearchaeota archaeon]|nr:hypothetical protein [Candidatus Pacearchaeota archaeon]